MWQSGFENGFPGGEWFGEIFDGLVPQGSAGPTSTAGLRSSAWAIVDKDSGEPVFSGTHAYKGWVNHSAAENHRAYPMLLTDIPTPLVNSFMVYLDANYDGMSSIDWIHLGTWGNFDQQGRTGTWALHTLSVRNRKLEFAHTRPFHGRYLGKGAQPDFPLRRWVRITIYIVYSAEGGFVQVWQDGVATLRANVIRPAHGVMPGMPDTVGNALHSAHWGIYASPAVREGMEYNDDIRICTLAAPLADLVSEPKC
jgi:hypothetical protein